MDVERNVTKNLTCWIDDTRPSLFTVITWEHAAVAKHIVHEYEPEAEMEHIRRTFEVNDEMFRKLYTKARPGIQYALTLDELWRVLKRLRLKSNVVHVHAHAEDRYKLLALGLPAGVGSG